MVWHSGPIFIWPQALHPHIPSSHKVLPCSPDTSGTLLNSGPGRGERRGIYCVPALGWTPSLWPESPSLCPSIMTSCLFFQHRQHLLQGGLGILLRAPRKLCPCHTLSSSRQKVSYGLGPCSGVFSESGSHASPMGAQLGALEPMGTPCALFSPPAPHLNKHLFGRAIGNGRTSTLSNIY